VPNTIRVVDERIVTASFCYYEGKSIIIRTGVIMFCGLAVLLSVCTC